jgi:hypothetical protein
VGEPPEDDVGEPGRLAILAGKVRTKLRVML